MQPLKDERRLRERRVEGIVPEAVFVEREVQQPLVVVGVVEERQPAERRHSSMRSGGSRWWPALANITAGASSTSRSMRGPKAAAARIARVPPRLEPMSDGRLRRPCGGQLAIELIEHPRHRQRGEIRLVEVRATERRCRADAAARRSTPPWSTVPTRQTRGDRRPDGAIRAASGTPGGTGT